MPALPMQRAHEETLACDLFVVLGSSLSVFPAAGFPGLAKDHGAALAIVNRDPTGMDDIADVVIHSGIGATLAAVLDSVGQQAGCFAQ
jgi:NAD-dependent deacetylase